MASDFHSHSKKSSARTLISGRDPGEFTSFQAHPWDADKPLPAVDISLFSAVGEIGLDKKRGPDFEFQLNRFGEMLESAEREKKSVVIHCVKAWDELLEFRKRFPSQNWLIHGFRGTPELLQQLQKRGFYISLGVAGIGRLLRPGFPLNRIGFETDDNEIPIENILALAAEKMQISVSEVEMITDRNFEEFLCLNVSSEPFC